MPLTTDNEVYTATVVSPLAYRLDSAILYNCFRDEYDIKYLITDFSITESIYNFSLQLAMNIKENVNFLEYAKLTGNEKIRIRLSRTKIGSKNVEKVDLTFIVTEYPVFSRFETHTQVYTIRAISEFAFFGKLKSISRSVKKPIKNIIYDILIKDLHIPENKIFLSETKCDTIKAVIPVMSPVDAINWLLRRAFDENGKPFYCYQTLFGEIRIESQSDFSNKPNYRTFKDGKFYTNEAQSPNDFNEKLERIISLASDLKMSKFISGLGGAFASTTMNLDISNKTAVYDSFDYLKDFDPTGSFNRGKTLSDGFYFEDEKKNNLGHYKNSKIFYIPKNSLNHGNRDIGYNSPISVGKLNRVQSAIENLDTITHDMTVFGDFNLNSGKAVEVILRKAVDPKTTVKLFDYFKTLKGEDLLLSGRYVLSAVIHKFDEEYSCAVRVKTDTFQPDFIV